MEKIVTETITDCCICGESIYLTKEVPDYFMGQPAHLHCASDMRDEVRVIPITPRDIDDIIA